MSFKSLALALLISTPTFAAAKYDLISVPHDQIDQHLVIGSDATATPEALQGLWWLNGNPLPDEVMSVASVQWEEIVEDGEVIGYRGEIPVYDQGIWGWHDSVAGRVLYELVRKMKLVYELEFNKDFTRGDIRPVFSPLGFLPFIEVPSSLFLKFSMTQVNENEYSRDSVLAGQAHTYRFRRIVDGQGNRLPAFDEFVEHAEVPNALLPICRIPSKSLPTKCVMQFRSHF